MIYKPVHSPPPSPLNNEAWELKNELVALVIWKIKDKASSEFQLPFEVKCRFCLILFSSTAGPALGCVGKMFFPVFYSWCQGVLSQSGKRCSSWLSWQRSELLCPQPRRRPMSEQGTNFLPSGVQVTPQAMPPLSIIWDPVTSGQYLGSSSGCH